MPISFDMTTLRPRIYHRYTTVPTAGSTARPLCIVNTALHCPTSHPGHGCFRNSFLQRNNTVHRSALFAPHLKQTLSQLRLPFPATSTFFDLYFLKKHLRHVSPRGSARCTTARGFTAGKQVATERYPKTARRRYCTTFVRLVASHPSIAFVNTTSTSPCHRPLSRMSN